MTCQQYEADLVDLARGVPDDGDGAASVRLHLETCAACAARFERERQLSEGLRAVAAATEVPDNDVAERRLMMAYAAAPRTVLAAPRHTMAIRWAAWAAAACALFLAGAWAAVEWRERTGLAQDTVVGARASVPAPAPGPPVSSGTVEPVGSPVAEPVPRLAGDRRASSPRVLPAARRSEMPRETDRLAGFIPLPAAGGFPGFDSGMIVRVALPTASLPAYGLAITPESAEVVNADLLVGQDGQARAIRLVSLVGGTRREPQ